MNAQGYSNGFVSDFLIERLKPVQFRRNGLTDRRDIGDADNDIKMLTDLINALK